MDQSVTFSGNRHKQYTIRKLTSEFGVTSRALRFYETKGLLHPTRRGTNRVFSHRDRARLKLILLGKRVGFSLTDIKQMLDLYDVDDGQVTQRKVALEKFRKQLKIMQKRKLEVEAAISEIEQNCALLENQQPVQVDLRTGRKTG